MSSKMKKMVTTAIAASAITGVAAAMPQVVHASEPVAIESSETVTSAEKQVPQNPTKEDVDSARLDNDSAKSDSDRKKAEVQKAKADYEHAKSSATTIVDETVSVDTARASVDSAKATVDTTTVARDAEKVKNDEISANLASAKKAEQVASATKDEADQRAGAAQVNKTVSDQSVDKAQKKVAEARVAEADLATAIENKKAKVANDKAKVADAKTEVDKAQKAEADRQTDLVNAENALEATKNRVKGMPYAKLTEADKNVIKDWFNYWNAEKAKGRSDVEISADEKAKEMSDVFDQICDRLMKEEKAYNGDTEHIDMHNLTDEQSGEIAQYSAAVVNSIREQLGLEKFSWSPIGQKYTNRFRDKEIESVDKGTYQWGHHTQLGESGQWYIKDYGDGTYLVADGSGGQVLSGSFRYNTSGKGSMTTMKDVKMSLLKGILNFFTVYKADTEHANMLLYGASKRSTDNTPYFLATTIFNVPNVGWGEGTVVQMDFVDACRTLSYQAGGMTLYDCGSSESSCPVYGGATKPVYHTDELIAAANKKVDNAKNALEDAQGIIKDKISVLKKAESILRQDENELNALLNGDSPLATAQRELADAIAKQTEARAILNNAIEEQRKAREAFEIARKALNDVQTMYDREKPASDARLVTLNARLATEQKILDDARSTYSVVSTRKNKEEAEKAYSVAADAYRKANRYYREILIRYLAGHPNTVVAADGMIMRRATAADARNIARKTAIKNKKTTESIVAAPKTADMSNVANLEVIALLAAGATVLAKRKRDQ